MRNRARLCRAGWYSYFPGDYRAYANKTKLVELLSIGTLTRPGEQLNSEVWWSISLWPWDTKIGKKNNQNNNIPKKNKRKTRFMVPSIQQLRKGKFSCHYLEEYEAVQPGSRQSIENSWVLRGESKKLGIISRCTLLSLQWNLTNVCDKISDVNQN